MTEIIYETETNLARKDLTRTHKAIPKWFKWSVISLCWALLIFGTYSLAHYYMGGIHDQLVSIQETNDENVQTLNTKLETLQTSLNEHKQQAVSLQQQFSVVESELGAVKEEMSLAGDTLSSSAETKQALSERITALSTELGELRKLIKKLEEAARAY
jgi:septal ring factor EnvC (AmiA/AmiB activator)